MDVSTPASLDLACPQAKTEIKKHVHMIEREVSIKQNTHVDYYNSNKIKHKTFIIELLSYTSHE